MRDFAERLIAFEATADKSGAAAPALLRVSEKLRPHLSTLMGNGGFRSLLSRALALANAEAPWLHAVHVKSDGSLEGLNELQSQLAPHDIREGSVALLAQLLGLLAAFVGKNMTLQLMHEIWPKLSPEGGEQE